MRETGMEFKMAVQAQVPAEVRAAVAAYLAARTDDETWEAYIDSLEPGVALDVATDLCQWTEADERAAAWIARLYEPDEDEPSASLRGLPPLSREFQAFYENDPGTTTDWHLSRPTIWTDGLWDVTLSGDDWEGTGQVSSVEIERWRASLAESPALDPWAWAACRAACRAWAPEWARSPEARGG
jgi:hypothetical protein